MKKAIIIGAGPAGLTAALELLKHTDIIPVVLEKSGDIGGISKTVNYKGNRIDIGGHRFFSKSDTVMEWWLNILAIEKGVDGAVDITYQNKTKHLDADKLPHSNADSAKEMLVRSRLSRIYFLRQFFSYPLKLSASTFRKLGYARSIKIFNSYLQARLSPIKDEKSLEDFFINKFGKELYHTFFKDYTEKVWGIDCNKISAEWGAQRVKGVSVTKTIQHAFKAAFSKKNKDLRQKNQETSLIEKFLYPKYGPGQLWEEVAAIIKEKGGELLLNKDVTKIICEANTIKAIEITDTNNNEISKLEADWFFSSMPVKELINKMDVSIDANVSEVANGLLYRDFLTVGVLLKKINTDNENHASNLKDNWIYIQERDVKVGRLQIFNNWSPYMVKDKNTVWIGMEYFCNEGDDLWQKPEEEMKAFGIAELEKIGLINKDDVLDTTIVKMEKAYPAYFGTYNRFDEVKTFTDKFTNLFLIGRNGMHKYNNSDHSMLTAITAVQNIIAGITSKQNIWDINTEQEYHEEKSNT